nr:MAG TPA: hypothetical protein [Caudoviricetes sp.]
MVEKHYQKWLRRSMLRWPRSDRSHFLKGVAFRDPL